MILFCDTSALVKFYIVEVGSEELKARVLEAEAVAVCRIAWAEAYAALSRRAREVPVDAVVMDHHTPVRRLQRPEWLGAQQNRFGPPPRTPASQPVLPEVIVQQTMAHPRHAQNTVPDVQQGRRHRWIGDPRHRHFDGP